VRIGRWLPAAFFAAVGAFPIWNVVSGLISGEIWRYARRHNDELVLFHDDPWAFTWLMILYLHMGLFSWAVAAWMVWSERRMDEMIDRRIRQQRLLEPEKH